MNELKKLTEWTHASLIAKGIQPLSSLEEIQMTPWSSIRRIATTKGNIYLKETEPLLSLEPFIIQILHDQLHAYVPLVIATNKELNCFLMYDAGKPFYHFNNSFERIHLIKEAIKQYKIIQEKSLHHVHAFLELGVPDWRLTQLPFLYQQLITQENLLMEDGMSVNDFKKLSSSFSTLEKLCAELTSFPILPTLDHCDLHGANILIAEKTKAITIIDWGETVITHPFLSMTAFLRSLVEYYSFKEEELWEICFANNIIAQSNHLEKMVALAKKIEPAYSALAFQRLFLASDKEKFKTAPNCKGRMTNYLLEFMR